MVDKKLHIIGESGKVLNSKDTKAEIKRSDFENNKDLLKLFDFYNTNKNGKSSEILDKKELDRMLSDLLKSANKDGVFEPDEIKKYLDNSGLPNSVAVDDLLVLVDNILVNSSVKKLTDDVDGVGTSSTIKQHLQEISPENITSVLKKYQKENDESLAEAISDEVGSLGSTRNGYLKIIKDKLVERGKQVGVDPSSFIQQFNSELNNMDLTIFGGGDTKKLDGIINNYLKQLEKPEKIYNENKSGIMQMMSKSDLCRTDEDRNEIFNKIMKYSKVNNPKSMISEIVKNSKNLAIKSAAQKLLQSNYLDYFPIFVASIVAQESQFREFDDNVFTDNGQGVMQLTKVLINDMYAHPGMYDDEFIERVHSEYPDSTSLYKAVQDREDSSLNFDVGTAGLKGKFNNVLRRLGNGSFNGLGINTNNPEALLELVAMGYNGNDEPKRDKKYGNELSQVRYVYARDVILRFKQYTPSGVSVRHYFEYNPKTDKFVNH